MDETAKTALKPESAVVKSSKKRRIVKKKRHVRQASAKPSDPTSSVSSTTKKQPPDRATSNECAAHTAVDSHDGSSAPMAVDTSSDTERSSSTSSPASTAAPSTPPDDSEAAKSPQWKDEDRVSTVRGLLRDNTKLMASEPLGAYVDSPVEPHAGPASPDSPPRATPTETAQPPEPKPEPKPEPEPEPMPQIPPGHHLVLADPTTFGGQLLRTLTRGALSAAGAHHTAVLVDSSSLHLAFSARALMRRTWEVVKGAEMNSSSNSSRRERAVRENMRANIQNRVIKPSSQMVILTSIPHSEARCIPHGVEGNHTKAVYDVMRDLELAFTAYHVAVQTDHACMWDMSKFHGTSANSIAPPTMTLGVFFPYDTIQVIWKLGGCPQSHVHTRRHDARFKVFVDMSSHAKVTFPISVIADYLKDLRPGMEGVDLMEDIPLEMVCEALAEKDAHASPARTTLLTAVMREPTLFCVRVNFVTEKHLRMTSRVQRIQRSHMSMATLDAFVYAWSAQMAADIAWLAMSKALRCSTTCPKWSNVSCTAIPMYYHAMDYDRGFLCVLNPLARLDDVWFDTHVNLHSDPLDIYKAKARITRVITERLLANCNESSHESKTEIKRRVALWSTRSGLQFVKTPACL